MTELLGSGLLSIAAFVAVISFVVVIHELGHYWAGRLFGVHADAFSIGFGPGVFGWTDRHGTRWRVAALPLGGYVKFRGDENAASAPDHAALQDMRERHPAPDTVFHFKPVWQRAIIVAAGPFANFLLAIALFAVLGAARGDVRLEPLIGQVVEASPAEAAGFRTGDLVTRMDGRSVDDFRDVMSHVMTRAGDPIRFTVERDGAQIDLTATPERQVREDGLGGERSMGFLGVGLSDQAERARETVAIWQAPAHGVERTVESAGLIFDYLGRLVTGRASVEHINGPIGIATTAGQLANSAVGSGPEGQIPVGSRLAALMLSLAALSALLSVALGLMNLLPVPVLDGGHLVYYAYEAAAGKPPSPAIQEAGFKLGLGLLLCMVVVATWNDLSYLRGLFS
ncbi:MAG: M50 family metallopeptidase [Oceanicaulis sp.]